MSSLQIEALGNFATYKALRPYLIIHNKKN